MSKKNPVYTTPKGIAVYPWLTKPDTKFNPDGEYRVKLRLPKDEVGDLITQLDTMAAQALVNAKDDIIKNAKNKKEEKEKLAKCVPAAPPYKDVLDDDGNETGEVELSFKMKAIVRPKKGDPFTQKPKLFDAKGKPITKPVMIGGGSEIKVAYQITPFFTAAVGAGVSLRLCAVQVIQANGGGGDAKSYGFGEEEGYEFEDSDDAFPSSEEGEDRVPVGDEADF